MSTAAVVEAVAVVPARPPTVARRALTALRQSPVTVSFVVLLWVLGAVSGSLLRGPSRQLTHDVGAGVPALLSGQVHTMLTSALWAHGLVSYVLVSGAVLAVGAALERRIGSGRLLAVALLTQLLGTTGGLLLVKLLAPLASTWGAHLETTATVGPSPLLVGVWIACTASFSALWRRRVRLGLLAVLLTLVLYGGLLADVLRLSTALAGLGVGVLLLGRGPTLAVVRSSRRETRVLVAVLLAASAGGALLAAISPSAVGPLAVLRYLFSSPAVDATELRAVCSDPGSAKLCAELTTQLRFDGVGAAVLAALPALLVLALADGLRRGRRFAWGTAVVVHLLLAALGVLLVVFTVRAQLPGEHVLGLRRSRDVLGLVLPVLQPLVILGVLLATRRSFTLTAPQGTYRRVAVVLGATVLGLLGTYLLVGGELAEDLTGHPGLGRLAADFPQRLVPPGYLGVVEPTLLPTGSVTTLLHDWTGVVLWTVAIVLLWVSFGRVSTSCDGDAAAARAILLRDGRTSLSYLTTWAGHSYWFSSSGQSFVAYRVVSGTAVTTGGPVGPQQEQQAALASFVEHCLTNGWTPCLYSITEDVRELASALGWPSVQVAEETVLPLGSLEFRGRKFQDVRTAVNRAARQEITAHWISFSTAPRAMTTQIRALSEEWVAGKGLPEMGFTLGGIDELDDPSVRCLVALDADGRLHGITSWLPVHDGGEVIGWTLDFMRRTADSFPGVMEFLIGSAALTLQAEGARFLSLSGAPLARVDSAVAARGLQALLDVMGRTLEPVYGFRTLLAFKAKFQPEYRPLYMAYPEAAVLPRIANAITRSYVPHLTLRQGLQIFRHR